MITTTYEMTTVKFQIYEAESEFDKWFNHERDSHSFWFALYDGRWEFQKGFSSYADLDIAGIESRFKDNQFIGRFFTKDLLQVEFLPVPHSALDFEVGELGLDCLEKEVQWFAEQFDKLGIRFMLGKYPYSKYLNLLLECEHETTVDGEGFSDYECRIAVVGWIESGHFKMIAEKIKA